MQAHERLSAWWRATGSEPTEANVGDAAACRIEERYGLRLPDDFRNYIRFAAPVSHFEDDEITLWVTPSEMKIIPYELAKGDYRLPAGDLLEAQAHTYLVFADYMMWSWCWVICCDEGSNRGKVAVLGGRPNHFVAPSFSAFINSYTTDLGSVC